MDNKKGTSNWKFLFFGWKVLRKNISIFLVVAFVLSLAFNLLLLLSNSAYLLASSTLSALTGTKTLITRQSDEIAELSTMIATQEATEKKLKRELASASRTLATYKAAQIETTKKLTRQSDEIAELSTMIATQEATEKKLKRELTDASGTLAAYKAAQNDTTRRVIRRNNYAATRKVATIPARAIPMIGTGVIVGVAALELSDMCKTVKDMAKLNKILDPSSAPTEDELTVCHAKVPTRKEIIDKTATGASDAWKALKEYKIPDMDDLIDQDMLDVDWSGISKSMGDTFKIGQEGMDDLLHKISNWWNVE